MAVEFNYTSSRAVPTTGSDPSCTLGSRVVVSLRCHQRYLSILGSSCRVAATNPMGRVKRATTHLGLRAVGISESMIPPKRALTEVGARPKTTAVGVVMFALATQSGEYFCPSTISTRKNIPKK